MSGAQHTTTIGQLPDELLGRILAAAATQPKDGCIDLRIASLLSRVCQRWRALCFSSPDLWESLTLTAPYGRIAGERSQWLAGKLWLLQRVGPLVQELHVADRLVAQGMMQPLLQAAPCTLRSLHLSMLWGAHMASLPQLLALSRTRFGSLGRLQLSANERLNNFGQHAQQQAGVPAAQQEGQLLDAVIAGVTALSGTLTELQWNTPGVEVLSLAPLTALQRLLRLEVAGCSTQARQQVPAPAQFSRLEEFDLRGAFSLELPPPQAAGTAFREASWAATPVRTLRLRGVAVAALPALLPALQPPAAGSLERLVLDELRSEDDAPVAAAALQACVPHLESIGELELSRSFCAGEVQQALLPQLARLHTLRLTNCGLAALPAGTYLSGLRTLSLADNDFRRLPPALLHATRLKELDVQGNRCLCPSPESLQQLVEGLDELQLLDLRRTSLDEELAEILREEAAARGLAVQLPNYKEDDDDWWLEGDGYYSSDSDSSGDGCPRYSWAGCAYASRW